MKKLLLLLWSAGLAVSAAAAAADTTVSFAGEREGDWSKTDGTEYVFRDGTAVIDGSHWDSKIWRSVEVTPGARYEISGTGRGTVRVYLITGWRDTWGEVNLSGEDWRERVADFRLPADAPLRMDLVIQVNAEKGRAEVRKISLTAVPEPVVDHPPVEVLRANRPDPEIVRGFQLGGFDEAKLQMVRDMGCTAVRVQLQAIAPQPTWTEENYPLLLDELEARAQMARRVGIKLIPTMFEHPGVAQEEREYWRSPDFEPGAIRYWQGIVERLLPYRDVIWGYDLLNEPLDYDQLPHPPREWRPLAEKLVRAIREIDSESWIIYEPGPGGGPGFGEYPLPDARIIYSCHFYEPGPFTHQGIEESYLQDPGLMAKAQEEVGVAYPGMVNGKRWDREALEEALRPAIEFQRRYQVPLYIGEFSAVAWAPPASTEAWLKDAIGIFEKHGWSWSYHAIFEWQGWDPRVFEGTLTHAEKLVYGGMDETVRGRVLLEAFRPEE